MVIAIGISALLWLLLALMRLIAHRRLPEAKGVSRVSWLHGALTGGLAALLALTAGHAGQDIYRDTVGPKLAQFGLIHAAPPGGEQAKSDPKDQKKGEAKPADSGSGR